MTEEGKTTGAQNAPTHQPSGNQHDEIRATVREGYAQVARGQGTCCGPASPCCSGTDVDEIAKKLGYTQAQLAAVPEGANLGLGCGNPTALASLGEGEVVLDLGCGAGFDCFLAADRVGQTGRVIGVDMTPEMLAKARENAAKGGYGNVEFRLGEIENLPAADNSVDAVISNCVINLSPNKKRVFEEASRVLNPGGRLTVSDVVLLKDLPEAIRDSPVGYTGCISGAVTKDEYLRLMKEAGFGDVRVAGEAPFPIDFLVNDPTMRSALEESGISAEDLADVAGSVVSVAVEAKKTG